MNLPKFMQLTFQSVDFSINAIHMAKTYDCKRNLSPIVFGKWHTREIGE